MSSVVNAESSMQSVANKLCMLSAIMLNVIMLSVMAPEKMKRWPILIVNCRSKAQNIGSLNSR